MEVSPDPKGRREKKKPGPIGRKEKLPLEVEVRTTIEYF